MSDYTSRTLDEMEPAFGGAFRKAGAELEVRSFGMNVIELPPGAGEHYPDHTHDHDGQEEVYVALRGSGRIVIDGSVEVPLDGEHFVRVGADSKRKVFAGPDGLRLLVLGGVPGQVYERPEVFAKSAPEAG